MFSCNIFFWACILLFWHAFYLFGIKICRHAKWFLGTATFCNLGMQISFLACKILFWECKIFHPKKSKCFSILQISSKVEVQKLIVFTFLTRLVEPDKKKIILDTLVWEGWPGHLIKNDHIWLKNVSSKIDIQHSNEHISSSWTAREQKFWNFVNLKFWLNLKINNFEKFQISWKKSQKIKKILKMSKIENSFSAN
jgi:hypothetical protein